VRAGDQVLVPRGTLHLFRSKFLWHGVCYERIRIRNYGLMAVDVSLMLHFEADFADIFEVRGTKRKGRGRPLAAAVHGGTVVLAYEGLDGVIRQTRLEFSPPPAATWDSGARFDLALQPKSEATVFATVSCEGGSHTPPLLSFENALAAAENALRDVQTASCAIDTSNERFNDWLDRTVADLYMMITETSEGPSPYAGVPWFSTVFGRDGILTAMECLWMNPGVARGVLAYLASTQSREV